MPAALQTTCEAMAQPLKQMGLNGNFHTEVRIAEDGTPYILDPTTRAGSPPIETMTVTIANWPEIVYAGANGELVEPHFVAKYGCQIILKSLWVLENFLAVKVPDEFFPFLKIRRGCIVDDQLWVIPSED